VLRYAVLWWYRDGLERVRLGSIQAQTSALLLLRCGLLWKEGASELSSDSYALPLISQLYCKVASSLSHRLIIFSSSQKINESIKARHLPSIDRQVTKRTLCLLCTITKTTSKIQARVTSPKGPKSIEGMCAIFSNQPLVHPSINPKEISLTQSMKV